DGRGKHARPVGRPASVSPSDRSLSGLQARLAVCASPFTMATSFSSQSSRGARFPTTHRSAVRGAASDNPAERARSFESLVRSYWNPVYKHARLRWHKPPAEARDLTQAFFARSFEKRSLDRYDPHKARFRTFLKTCLDRFAMEEARNARRHKRGGGAVHLSLDFERAEEEIAQAGPLVANPDDCFDQEWVRGLLGGAVEGLRAACAASGRETTFRVFEMYVLDDEPSDGPDKRSYASVADALGLTVSDVTNYLAWARRQFRRIAL